MIEVKSRLDQIIIITKSQSFFLLPKWPNCLLIVKEKEKLTLNNGVVKRVIHTYDPETNHVALYEKLENGDNSYLSNFTLTDEEAAHFEKTNSELLTENVLNSLNDSKDVSSSIQDQINNAMSTSAVDKMECIEYTMHSTVNQQLPETIKIQNDNNNNNNGLQ